MIDIRYDDRHMEIRGHAQYDAYGKDIVCAGVSSMWLALVNKIASDDDEGLVIADVRTDTDDEVKLINIKYVHPNHKDIFRHYWHMIIDGFELMSETYSDHVQISRM